MYKRKHTSKWLLTISIFINPRLCYSKIVLEAHCCCLSKMSNKCVWCFLQHFNSSVSKYFTALTKEGLQDLWEKRVIIVVFAGLLEGSAGSE